MTDEEKEVILRRTQEECDAIKRRDCCKCAYSSTDNQKYVSQSTCDYITIVGRSRPCLAGDCREAGIFVEKKAPRKKNAPVVNGGGEK